MTESKTLDELITQYYGEPGSAEREEFEMASLAFRLGVMLKEERKSAQLTQAELAARSGTKKSYISRVEMGLSDVQLSTYRRIVEQGLGKQLVIAIA
jgi:ribosome-binding protein aMBF1 (putative translation factor)